MLKVEGVIPALVTPFDQEEAVNIPVLRQMVQRQIQAKVDGIFCLGTNGEFYAMNFDEKLQVAEAVVDEAAGKLPVYVGAGCTSTKETIELAKRAESIGADALSLITPYFISYTQDELIRHFTKVAEATSLPIVLYNMPARTTNALQPRTVGTLAKVPNIVGIKDSSGSFDTILQYIEQTAGEAFSVLSGNDGLILSTLMAGGKGTVSAMANILPDTIVSIYEHWKNGRLEEAEAQQRVLRIARQALRIGTQPASLKAFLDQLGLNAGPARQPVGALSEQGLAQLNRIVGAYLKAASQ